MSRSLKAKGKRKVDEIIKEDSKRTDSNQDHRAPVSVGNQPLSKKKKDEKNKVKKKIQKKEIEKKKKSVKVSEIIEKES